MLGRLALTLLFHCAPPSHPLAVLQADGATPLYVASEGGDVRAVQALLRANASVTIARVREHCETGLCWVIVVARG